MTRRVLILVCACAGLLWLLGLGAYPLLESTEGRYASVAWDMAHGGDWITPTFNGAALLTKPPLAYWMGAAALKLLPDREWAVRLPATLTLVMCAWLTLRLALVLGLDERRSRWAGLMALLSPLAVAQGHMTTGDIFLWTGALAACTAALDDRPRLMTRALTGLGLAVGFMAKGHMALFWTVIPLGTWALTGRDRWRPAARLFHPVALTVFIVLAAPWYATVIHRHQALLGYWLGDETAARIASTRHGRAEPWWYFLPMVPALMLPWLPELWRGLRTPAAAAVARRRALLLLWVLVPLLVFSISGSKRPNYLLPMVSPLAVLAAAGWPDRTSRGPRVRTLGWLALAVAWPFALGALHLGPPTGDLVAEARAADLPLACFREMPSSVVFYARGPVPTFYFARDTRFGGPGRDATFREEPLRNHLRGGGGVLTAPRFLPDLARIAGAPPVTVAARDGAVLVRAAPVPPPTRKQTP